MLVKTSEIYCWEDYTARLEDSKIKDRAKTVRTRGTRFLSRTNSAHIGHGKKQKAIIKGDKNSNYIFAVLISRIDTARIPSSQAAIQASFAGPNWIDIDNRHYGHRLKYPIKPSTPQRG
jgi:hypothetical protein